MTEQKEKALRTIWKTSDCEKLPYMNIFIQFKLGSQ